MSVVYRLLTLVALSSFAGAAAADFPALPNDSWYRVEIVIFERLADVDPASTQEILVSHAPRAYPRDVFAFDDDSSRAAAYPLDAETRAIPALPAVDIANKSVQAQPAALPAGSTDPRGARREAHRGLSVAIAGSSVPVRARQHAAADAGRRQAAAQQLLSRRISPRVDSAGSGPRSVAADA